MISTTSRNWSCSGSGVVHSRMPAAAASDSSAGISHGTPDKVGDSDSRRSPTRFQSMPGSRARSRRRSRLARK
ncbi:hypothetical protein D9M72_487810 [compost metagenome]